MDTEKKVLERLFHSGGICDYSNYFFVIAFGLQVAMDQYQVIQSLSKEPTKLEAVESVKVMRESDRILKGLKNEN